MTALDEASTRAVAELARSVELQQIRTVEFHSRLVSQAPAMTEQIHLDLNANVESGLVEGGFGVEGKFDVKASGPSRTTFAEFSIRIQASYRVPGPAPEAKAVDAFARSNGVIHLWPYFRAYVQQSCGQLSIPPIVIPPFRIKVAEAPK